jgi:phospholipase C
MQTRTLARPGPGWRTRKACRVGVSSGGDAVSKRGRRLTRRDVLKAGAAAGVLGAVGAGLRSSEGRLIEAALAGSSSGSLADVEHVVLLMQENRSFDHYFGTMAGVRGFGDTTSYSSYPGGPATDPCSVFRQTMKGTSVTGTPAPPFALADGETSLWPFELVTKPPTVAGQTTNDITHDWGPQHGAWNNGAMDHFVVEHLANDPTAKLQLSSAQGGLAPGPSSVPTGITTMGYYRQRDTLAFYRALADAFTVCDGYHCSLLGPTDPNRLMWMSGSFGAHSEDVGGPVLTTYSPSGQQLYGTLDWPTMPELLTEAGVSWKVYQDPVSKVLFNDLLYFKNFFKPSTTADAQNAANGLDPVFPSDFASDVATGTLPQVSWILPQAQSCEHPATPPEYGEWLVSQIIQMLLVNPEVWEHTVFVIIYDENGGFFDHVSPPAPGPMVTSVGNIPSQASSLYANGVPTYWQGFPTSASPLHLTDGEYVTAANPTNAAGGPPGDWGGVLGPGGLGFRTPALVVSPFSAGGWVCSDVFDHVSTLKLVESLFLDGTGVLDGLHVSQWRYNTVGDMTSALPSSDCPDPAVPPLPPTSLLYPQTAAQALMDTLTGTEDFAPAYPPPASNSDAYLSPDSESIARRPTPTRPGPPT